MATPAGVLAVTVVAETKLTSVAAIPPILTVAPSTKSSPVIVTSVPPEIGPLWGEIPVTVGVGM